MVFGLKEDKKKATKPEDVQSSASKKNDDGKSNGNADEAQELLKKMQEKEDNGECAFC